MEKHQLSSQADEIDEELEEIPQEEPQASEEWEAEPDETESETKNKKTTEKPAQKIALRVAAIAAAVVLIVTVTPLRGYLHSLAENATLGKMKKSSRGFSVEIVEADVANDFLYLTVNESYSKKLVVRDSETQTYTLPDIDYSGSVNDSDGDSIAFSSDNFLYLQYDNAAYADYRFNPEDRTVTGIDDWYKTNEKLTIAAKYKIYLPDLIDWMDDKDETYTCSLNVSDEASGSNMKFKFDIDDVSDVVDSQTCFINHWVDVDEATLVFQQMEISSRCMDVIIEWDAYDTVNYVPDTRAELLVSKNGDEESDVTLTTHMEKQSQSDEEEQAADFPSYLKIDGKSYLILSDYASEHDFAGSDVTIEIKELICDYSGLNQHENELKDIVFKTKKVTDKQYTVDNQITIGDIQIKLNAINTLNPEENRPYGYLEYTYSYLGFDGSVKYTGEGNLLHWVGYMDLMNPKTNETAKFSIQYYNMPDEDIAGFHIVNGLQAESYYLKNPSAFLKSLSDWHIVSVTEVLRDTYDDGNVEDYTRQVYQNEWTNAKFADVKVTGLRGRKYIYFTFE